MVILMKSMGIMKNIIVLLIFLMVNLILKILLFLMVL
nr:MAG TPA_asm: hypothetical protein [Caudoviricetes sp.]